MNELCRPNLSLRTGLPLGGTETSWRRRKQNKRKKKKKKNQKGGELIERNCN